MSTPHVTLDDAVEQPTMHVIVAQPYGRDTDALIKLFELADRIQAQDRLGWRGRRELAKILKGARLFNLFSQPSTRTRFSFEVAGRMLGMDVISSENAGEFSSEIKGESIEDTVQVLTEFGADAIVIRHPLENTAAHAATVSPVPIINAGDGGNQHPTQALLDVYTIWKEFGHRLDNLNIVMVGDLRHGRTARSLAYLMARFEGVRMHFIAPKGLEMGTDDPDSNGILKYLDHHNTEYQSSNHLTKSTLAEADIVYVTRIRIEQITRELAGGPRYSSFPDPYIHEGFRQEIARTYTDLASQLRMERHHAMGMKPTARIMHPLPRVSTSAIDRFTGVPLVPEISVSVDGDERAKYFEQAGNGVPLRAALLLSLLAGSPRALT